MAKKYLDYNGLQYFWQKIKSIIPNFTSDLTNDSGFVTTDDDIEWVGVLNGGGGGSLELINHVTTDEDVMSITVDKDSNGRPFELNKFVVFVKLMPNSTGQTGWIRLFPNVYSSPMAIGSGNGITEGSWRAIFTGSINGGIFIPGVSVCTVNPKSVPYILTTNISGMNQGGGEFVFPYEVDKFTSFQWTGYQPSIGAGSEIWVYGVRV